MRALSSLKEAGIPVMRTPSDYTKRIQNILGLATFTDFNFNSLLDYWITNVGQVPPSWKSLLLIIRQLNLDDLAQKMESYLSGAVEEQPRHSEEKMAMAKLEGERFCDMSVFYFNSLYVYCLRGW